MDNKIIKHFKKADPALYKVIKSLDNLTDLPKLPKEDYFMDLVNSIISQQLSGKAAETIFKRFKSLYTNSKVTAQKTLKLKDNKLRAAGISSQKIKYIKDLSKKVLDNELDLIALGTLSEQEVITELVKVKGIGKWTAEMFLIFTLRRPDVFSHGDLGLNTAIKRIYKLDNYSVEVVENIIAKWSPYKSTASRILWLSLDNR